MLMLFKVTRNLEKACSKCGATHPYKVENGTLLDIVEYRYMGKVDDVQLFDLYLEDGDFLVCVRETFFEEANSD